MRPPLSRFVSLAMLCVLLAPGAAPAQTNLLAQARQLVVVTAPDWNATKGSLRRFERTDANATWKPVGDPESVSLGRGGLGWGQAHQTPSDVAGPRKREGDGRAPAGVFPLGQAFAYDPDELGPTRTPVLRLTPDILCVDDGASRSYNRIIDQRVVGPKDWSSAETMRRDDELYRFGLEVKHNDANVPGGGSCIFLHVRSQPGYKTSGCTAMRPALIQELIRWLDPGMKPILVQAPGPELDRIVSLPGE